MVIDILIRNVPTIAHISIGRSFYMPDSKQTLPNAAEVWRGYYQSARPTCGDVY